MAKNTLVINGKFNPFSYEDLVKPLRYATEQHQQVEEAYSELSTAADMWANIATNEKDSKAAQMYSKYSDDLRKQADNLATYGLNGNSRRELFNMKRRYMSEIKPIEDAYNARVEDIKLQRELSAKDSSLIWSSPATSASIDSYLGGKRPEYYSVSGDDMYKRAAAEAKSISDRYVTTEEGRAFNGAYFDMVERQGINPMTAMAILRNTNAFPEFNAMLERLRGGSNYGKLDDAGKAQIDNRILEGINVGLGYSEKHSLHNNWPEQQASQYAYSRALARDKAALAAMSAQAPGANVLPMNSLRLQLPGNGSRRDQKKVDKITKGPIMSALANGGKDQRVDMREALKRATLMNNGTLRSKAGDSRFQMFDGSGNMLSKDKFVAQGADQASKANLGKIYDSFVKDIRNSGYETESITFDDLQNYLNDTAAGNNSTLTFGIELPIGSLGAGNDDVFNRIRSKTSNGKQIEEVTAFAGDRVRTSGKPIDLSKIDTKSLNFAMTYDGLLIFDGTNYGLVRPENLGSLAESSMRSLQQNYAEARGDIKRAYDQLVKARKIPADMSFETFLNREYFDSYRTYQDVLQEILQPAMLDMINALNYSFSSTPINPLDKKKLVAAPSSDTDDDEDTDIE